MTIRIEALPTPLVEALRHGAPDANGQPAERAVSDGDGAPCRHCLHDVPAGAVMLILAARPFPRPQPYAEVGPIFLCAGDCPRWAGPGLPPALRIRPDYLIRGYDAADRIIYGTGRTVRAARLEAACERVFRDPDVAYIHIRSARNNCYQARVEREGGRP